MSVTQSLDTHNSVGRLLRNVLLDFAQFEREMTADRTRDKMFQRAQKGLWNGGNVPYGYALENKEAHRQRSGSRSLAIHVSPFRRSSVALWIACRTAPPWLVHAGGQALGQDGARGRKQKTDREDGRLLLRLLRENRFPRIWTPNPENRDLRQLLWHQHRLVQMRTRIMNQLQAVAMNEGYRWKKKLFSEKGRARLKSFRSRPGPTGAEKNYWSCWTSWIPRLRS